MSDEEKVYQGTVEWFSPQKGFGFIKRDEDNSADMFVHYSNIAMEGYKTLEKGWRVEFTMGANKRGPQAEDVKIISKDAVEEEKASTDKEESAQE